MPDIQGLNVGGTTFDIDDPNDVATEGGELLDTVINYDSATTPTIGSFTAFLEQFVSGTKVGQWFKNFRAGCDFILHIGSLVNNCVTDNEALPLAASQGKVLMDEITQLNSALDDVNSALNILGTEYYSGTESLALTANDYTWGTKTISLPVGKYIVFAHASIPAGSATGAVYVDRGDGNTLPSVERRQSFYGASSTTQRCTVCFSITLTVARELCIRIYSSEAVTATDCEVAAIRIK